MYWTLDCATVLWVDMTGVALFLQLANDQSAPGSVVHVVLTVKLAQTLALSLSALPLEKSTNLQDLTLEMRHAVCRKKTKTERLRSNFIVSNKLGHCTDLEVRDLTGKVSGGGI